MSESNGPGNQVGRKSAITHVVSDNSTNTKLRQRTILVTGFLEAFGVVIAYPLVWSGYVVFKISSLFGIVAKQPAYTQESTAFHTNPLGVSFRRFGLHEHYQE